MSREGPYNRLKRVAQDFINRCIYPETRTMWRYSEEELEGPWDLTDLVERVRAADQLGWDVQLRWEANEGLVVYYVKRPGSPPGLLRW